MLYILKTLDRWQSRYDDPWKIVFRKAGLLEDPYRVTIKGRELEFTVREAERDRGALEEFYFVDGYEELSLSDFEQVVDIGAHIGVFAIEAAASCERVLAFEPNPETFAVLEENLELNGVRNVEAQQAAVSDTTGEAVLYKAAGSLSDSTQCKRGEREIRVESITLGQVIERLPEDAGKTLLKLDCEGAEFPVIKNADVAQLCRFDTIFLEWHGDAGDPAELVGVLEQAGFMAECVEDPRERLKRDLGYVMAVQDG